MGPPEHQHMKRRRLSLLYMALSGSLYVAYVVFLVQNLDRLPEARFSVFNSLVSVAFFIFLAALLSYRRPDHRIAWILVLIALLLQTSQVSQVFTILYTRAVQVDPAMYVLANLWLLLIGFAASILAFMFIVFPDGRLPGDSWRPIYLLLLISAGSTILYIREAWLNPGELAPVGGPLLGQVGGTSALPERISLFCALILMMLALVSQIGRFRQGGHIQRQQIKWVMYAIGIWIASFFLALLIPSLSILIFPIVAALIPLSITIAILRFGLYDIDTIINRTLVYAALTAILGGVYSISIVLMEALTRAISGEQSPLVIVISTLLIAALFNPLRGWLQTLIDRAFFRSKYDAERILERFAAEIRDEVSIRRLSDKLIATAGRTLQPEKINLMIKDQIQ